MGCLYVICIVCLYLCICISGVCIDVSANTQDSTDFQVSAKTRPS